MIIPFLSKYRQQYYYERDFWMAKAEKRRAMLLTCAIVACVTITVLLWMLR
jgi:hypothetical protein